MNQFDNARHVEVKTKSSENVMKNDEMQNTDALCVEAKQVAPIAEVLCSILCQNGHQQCDSYLLLQVPTSLQAKLLQTDDNRLHT